jgi:hypothetical protein
MEEFTMKYINPEMKISMFNAESVRTDDPVPTLAPVSGAYNTATKSLEETFISAAGNAAPTLVFKWE